MGRIVIVCYRPKPGQQEALRALMRTHLPILRAEGLVTERASILGEAADGTIVEMFEWRSAEAIAAAHESPAVLAMWAEYEKACDYVPVASLAEASQLFAELRPFA